MPRYYIVCALYLIVAIFGGGVLAVSAAPSVSLWTQSSSNSALLAAIEQFAQETGVEVDVRGIDWTTDAVFVAVAGGASPDTFTHGSAALGAFVGSGILMPLDQVVNQWSFMKDMIPQIRDWNSYEGKLYALPWNGVVMRDLVYREDLWEESGVNPAQPPQGWRDLANVGKKLVRFSPEGNMTRSAVYLAKTGFGAQQAFLAFQVQSGGSMFKDGKPMMNDQPTIDALQFYVDMFYEYRLEDYSFNGNVLQGTATAAWDNISLMGRAEDMGVRTGVTTFPYRSRPASFAAADWIGVPQATKNRDYAIKLLQFIIRPETQKVMNEVAGGTIPAYRQALRWEWVKKNPAIDHFVNALEYGVPNPAHPLWFELRTVLVKSTEQALRREAPVTSVLGELQRQMDQIVFQ